MVVAGADLDRAFYVQERVDQYKEYARLVEFTDLMLRGATQKPQAYANTCNEGALTWIQVGDCVSCVIRDVTIWGRFDIIATTAQAEDVGIRLFAAYVSPTEKGAVLTARISNVELANLHTALYVQDRSFYSLSYFDLIGTYYGIRELGLMEVYNEPKVSHGNINAQCKGIWVENTGGRDYDDVTIRRHHSGGLTSINWIGIHARHVENLRINGCTIQPAYEAGAQAGPDTGIYLETGCNGIVDGCKFGDNLNDCIRINDCAGVMIGGNVLLGNPTSSDPATYLRLTNKARRIHVTARPAISSTAAVPNYKLLMIDESAGPVDRSTLEVDLIADPYTFEPTFKDVVAGYTSTGKFGRYTRAGRRVEFEIKLQWNSLAANQNPVKIELPLATDSVGSGVLVLNPKMSTGLALGTGPIQPYLIDDAGKKVLGLVDANNNVVTYNGGRVLPLGRLVITGSYWIPK